MTDKDHKVARLGPFFFDSWDYDAETDTVSFRSAGSEGAREWTSPEGHLVKVLDSESKIVGLEVHGYQALIEEGPIEVTFPPLPDPSLPKSAFLLFSGTGTVPCC